MTGALMPGNVRNYGGWNVSIMPLNIPTLSQHDTQQQHRVSPANSPVTGTNHRHFPASIQPPHSIARIRLMLISKVGSPGTSSSDLLGTG